MACGNGPCRGRWKRRAAALAAVMMLAAAGAGRAQQSRNAESGTRSVRGEVSDAHGVPVDGAAVQLKDTKTLQIRSYVTQDGGKYHFSGLNPNVDYELTARYREATSKTHTLSMFSGGRDAVVDLKLRK